MKKSKISSLALVLSLCLALLLSACSSAASSTSVASSAQSTPSASASNPTESITPVDLNIAIVVFGAFGDNGFNDMSKQGLERAIDELGIKGQAFESGGYDITKVEPLILDLCEDASYDAIFTMGAACREATENAAAQFPDQKFVVFDAEATYAEKDLPNIASVTFRQNEAAFLGGVVAGYTTTNDMEKANKDKTVGVVLLRDNAVINDFLVGYIEGCHYIDKDIKILSAYNNSASDTAKSKELTINMASQGADVIFGVASLATLGVIDGCKEKGIYAIGVDNDMAMQLKTTDESAASLILTSVLKNTNVAVFRTINSMATAPEAVKWGAVESVGFTENCVGIAKTDVYKKLVPAELQGIIETCEADIISGKIVVSTAFGMPTEDVAALRETAAK